MLGVAQIRLVRSTAPTIRSNERLEESCGLRLGHSGIADHVIPLFEKVGFFKGVREGFVQPKSLDVEASKVPDQPLLQQIDRQNGEARQSLGPDEVDGSGSAHFFEPADT